MREAFTITALAKQSGVPTKTLRYWESLGLLPRAARTHTGYRIFAFESFRYIAFIRKSKSIGLTLAEMRELLRLTRTGHCPCPEVVNWTTEKTKSLEAEIRSLSLLLRRLKRIRGRWSKDSCGRGKCDDVCYLIAELPECKSLEGGKRYAKALAHSDCCRGNPCGERVASAGGRGELLPALLPALSRQVGRTKMAGTHT
ncbi:MAG: MerR family DNA-binding transcriptional regulator [Candidatus Acidiferrales bacterium]